MLFVLLIMPPSKVCPQCQAVVYTTKAIFAKARSKTKVPLLYCAEGLALPCFLVFTGVQCIAIMSNICCTICITSGIIISMK